MGVARRRTGIVLRLVTVVSAFAAGALLLGSPATATDTPRSLVGTFRIAGGSCNPVTKSITGSWFKLIFPQGNTNTGFFFQNSTSLCYDKGYTVISGGSQGGIVTGEFQPGPRLAFDKNGNARANAIMRPVPFAAVDLSLGSAATDPQSSRGASAPSVSDRAGRLTGNVEALFAAWRNTFMNQGSPKPGGRRPGLTQPVSGRYDARTRRFVLTWTSQIVGGPFTGFIGYWHIAGTFVPHS
jgi:hypothetical protein